MIVTPATRTARVGGMLLINVSLSGIVQIGDCATFEPVSNALAVQREFDHSSAGEAYFESYKVFTMPLPRFSRIAFLSPTLSPDLTRTNNCPDIHVGSIQVIDTGTSSMIKAGNAVAVRAVTRTMQIRQYFNRRMGMS